VFLERRPELAGPLAIAFVDYHRFTAINYKLPLLDIMVGAAHLVAEANGITNAGHVRDKIAKLIAWTETVRGLAELAAVRAREGAQGVWMPDPLAVNVAKYTFAHGFHDAAATLMDLAGGLLVTPAPAARTGRIPRSGRCWKSITRPRCLLSSGCGSSTSSAI
jgi:aromatic ring hydroxylase